MVEKNWSDKKSRQYYSCIYAEAGSATKFQPDQEGRKNLMFGHLIRFWAPSRAGHFLATLHENNAKHSSEWSGEKIMDIVYTHV